MNISYDMLIIRGCYAINQYQKLKTDLIENYKIYRKTTQPSSQANNDRQRNPLL